MDNPVRKKKHTIVFFCLQIGSQSRTFALGSSAAHQSTNCPIARSPRGHCNRERSDVTDLSHRKWLSQGKRLCQQHAELGNKGVGSGRGKSGNRLSQKGPPRFDGSWVTGRRRTAVLGWTAPRVRSPTSTFARR